MTSNEFIPILQAPLQDAKELLAACVQAGIPARLGRDDHCTKGCSPKVMLLVAPGDAVKVQELLARRWHDLVATVDGDIQAVGVGIEVAESEEPPCPACGTRAALVAGACAECGLQLA